MRLYVDLGELDADDRAAVRGMQSDQVIAIAQRVLHPYTLDVKEIAWFSVYEVGQRLTDKFDDVPDELVGARTPRVFIAGDACHTHSAKAGQGMNVSMQDAFNLGWKLAAVLEGRSPESLLHTYSAERQAIAQELIDFDKEWSAIMASPPEDPANPGAGGVDPAELQRYFERVASVHRGRRHPLRALVAHRRGDTPAPRRGIPSRDAVPLGVGDPPRRRQAGAARPRRPSRRPLAALRVRRRSRARRPGVTAASAVRAPRALARLAGAAVYPDRTPTSTACSTYARSSSSTTATSRSPTCRRCSLPRKGRSAWSTTRRRSRLTRGGDDIFDLRGIDRDRARSSSFGPTSTSPHVLPLDAYAELTAFFAPLLTNRGVGTQHGIEVFDPYRQAKAVVVRQSPR